MDSSTPDEVALVDQVLRAREDVDAFVEFVGGLRQDPAHRAWQRLWSEHDRSVLFAPVGHGKTTQLRLRILWELGRNPDLQVAFIGATERHPKRVLRAIKADIERNRRLRLVFPNMRPAEPWGATELQLERPSREPDPSLSLFGLFGRILGSRADLVVLDDVCNFENTLTEESREKASEWMGEVLSRLRPNARVITIGHVWHEQDVLHRLGRKDGWVVRRDEALEADEGGAMRALAPSVMSVADIERKRAELGPRFAELMLFNRLVSEATGRFRQSWFDACLARGRGMAFAEKWDPSDAPTYCGVDLGHRKRRGSDRTVLWTACVLPDGTRRVLDVRSGLWTGPEIVDQIIDVHRRYGAIVAIESNAAQAMLADFADTVATVPIRQHNTGAHNKHSMQFGVESLGLELQRKKWMLPCDKYLRPPEEIAKAIQECMAYDPSRHSGDRLMAWWIARECIRESGHGLEPFAPVMVPDWMHGGPQAPESMWDLLAR